MATTATSIEIGKASRSKRKRINLDPFRDPARPGDHRGYPGRLPVLLHGVHLAEDIV